MSSPIVSRLFAHVGMPVPAEKHLARLLARCPRERLVRVCAWYAWEWYRDSSPAVLLAGVRLLVRGWDDFFMAQTFPHGAVLVNMEAPATGRALVTRHRRTGKGWSKERISTTAEIRREIELATRWLSRVAGCILHDDCAENPELGAACALDQETAWGSRASAAHP